MSANSAAPASTWRISSTSAACLRSKARRPASGPCAILPIRRRSSRSRFLPMSLHDSWSSEAICKVVSLRPNAQPAGFEPALRFAMEHSQTRAIDAPMARILQLTLNGRPRTDAVAENVLLLDYLREQVGLTGTKTGCDGGECGACTVLVDDAPRLSCLTLAATLDGRRVDTIESLASDGRLSAVQRGF